MHDPYVLVDGGYHRWCHTMSASRLNVNPDFIAWRKRLESVRKDIEDVFGILKGRFRILKLPLMFHKKAQIDNIVHCCVALHNMLRDWDGLTVWENEVDWRGADSLFCAANDDLGIPVVNGREVAPSADYSYLDSSIDSLVETRVEEGADFFELQRKLLKHFTIASAKNLLVWLRS
jgi:hypothetical protein